MFVYDEIIKAIANRNSEVKNETEESNGNTTEIEDANYLRVATQILPLLPPGAEKNSVILAASLKYFKSQQQEEGLLLLTKMGNARQVMYWLLQHYFKERKSGKNTDDLETLIIHFHEESGVKLSDCYGMLEKVKEKGSSKIKDAFLSFEQRSTTDYLNSNPLMADSVQAFSILPLILISFLSIAVICPLLALIVGSVSVIPFIATVFL